MNRKSVCITVVLAPAPLPIDLSLLVDDAMGFFSGYPAMEPQLSYVDDCIENQKYILKYILKNLSEIK